MYIKMMWWSLRTGYTAATLILYLVFLKNIDYHDGYKELNGNIDMNTFELKWNIYGTLQLLHLVTSVFLLLLSFNLASSLASLSIVSSNFLGVSSWLPVTSFGSKCFNFMILQTISSSSSSSKILADNAEPLCHWSWSLWSWQMTGP